MVTIDNKKCLFWGALASLAVIAAYIYILEENILSSNTLKYFKCVFC